MHVVLLGLRRYNTWGRTKRESTNSAKAAYPRGAAVVQVSSARHQLNWGHVTPGPGTQSGAGPVLVTAE